MDGVVAIKNVYPVLFQQMDKVKSPENMRQSGLIGVSWAGSGGESAALLRDRYLAADGTENVIKVLEELEDEKLNDIDFIELNAAQAAALAACSRWKTHLSPARGCKGSGATCPFPAIIWRMTKFRGRCIGSARWRRALF